MADVKSKKIIKTKKSKKTSLPIKLSGKNSLSPDSKTKENEEEAKNIFNLEEVLICGGDKEDYERLLTLDENDELETKDEDCDESSMNYIRNELTLFLKDIGLNQHENKSDNVEENSEPKKIVTEGKKKKIKQKQENSSSSETLNVLKETHPKIQIKLTEDSTEYLSSFPYKKYNVLLLKHCVPWYEQIRTLPKEMSMLKEKQLDVIHNVAKQYWETDTDIYQTMKEKDKSSDATWLKTVIKSGTQSDKVAALTMLTQESPIHCMRSLEALMNMARKKARREALIAVDSLRHIWIADLLPDVKLRRFNQYPIEKLKSLSKDGSKESQIKLLIIMAYEQELKNVYENFIGILEDLSKDSLTNIRSKVLGIIYELLVMKPEQEQKLLPMLVNKLGDPDRKVASKTSYLLSQLVSKHPNMKSIVILEVERMLYRTNVSEKAQYYAICFINQIALSHQENKIASKLIKVYFSFFKVFAKKVQNSNYKTTNSQQSKLLSGLLTGVNRAYPFAKGDDTEYDDQLNTLFRLTHVKHLSTSIQAFMLIYQVMESRQSVSDRYYQALYGKLLDPDIKTSSKHTMLLNLLFKSIKNDPILKRVKSFIKRLLQICSQDQPSFVCGVMFLLSEIIKVKPGIKSMMEQAEEENEEENFVDVKYEENEEENVSSDEECENKDNNDNVDSDKPKHASWTFYNSDNRNESYNINHRNPLYASAEQACTWELIPMIKHFHPSVEHFTMSVLKGEQIAYKGDPLQDFTLIRFLDRFVYRNPKKRDVEHGHSLMQPKDSSLRLKEEPMNSKIFLQKSEEKIRQDEVFFYRYFKQKEIVKKNKHDGEGSDEEGDQDGEDEEIDDLDFAGEMKRSKDILKKRKGDDDEDNSSSEEEEDGGSEDESFDYNDTEDESEEDYDIKKKNNFTDKDYEKALFDNLNSDGESEDDNEESAGQGETLDSMFASADQFAHMLEDDSATKANMKQTKWEERQERKEWRTRKKFDRKRKPEQRKHFGKKMKK